MGENTSGFLKGLKGIFIEEDPVTTPTTEKANTASVPVAAPVAPVTPMAATDAPTTEEIKIAESSIASWSGFKGLENLKKFAAIETKLKGKILDPSALRVASFEMAEVAGVDQKAVVDEAKSAVSQVLVKLPETKSSLSSQLVVIDQQETSERQTLETQIAQHEQNLAALRGRLGSLSTDVTQAKISLQRQFDITQQVANLFVEQWSSLTESKKS